MAFDSFAVTVGATGVASLAGRVALAELLASLLPCFAVAVIDVPAAAALWEMVTIPLAPSMLTPAFAGDNVHVVPVFVATTLSVPMLISTLSALALGVTVTLAFDSFAVTVGAAGVASLGVAFVTSLGALRNDPRSPASLSGPVLGSSYTVIALTSPSPILDTT